MASIDDGSILIELISLSGRVSPRADTIQEVTRPGVDGHSFRRLGERAPAFSSRLLLDIADPTGLQVTDTVRQLRDMQGKVVTIIDDHGFQTENLVCLSMILVRHDEIIAGAGGVAETTPDWLVEFRAQLQPTDR